MQTVTKKDLIERIADKTDEKRNIVKNVVQLFLDEIVDELASGNRLEFRDFGVFETTVRKARRAQNPRKRQAVWVPQRTTVKFKLGRLMKLKLEALDQQRDTAAQGRPAPDDLPVAALKSQQQKPIAGPCSGRRVVLWGRTCVEGCDRTCVDYARRAKRRGQPWHAGIDVVTEDTPLASARPSFQPALPRDPPTDRRGCVVVRPAADSRRFARPVHASCRRNTRL